MAKFHTLNSYILLKKSVNNASISYIRGKYCVVKKPDTLIFPRAARLLSSVKISCFALLREVI